MRILSRRFLASYLCALLAIAAGTLLALAIVDMLVDFDAIVEGGAAGLAALLARVPERHLAEVLPFASFAAAFLATALPSRRGELLAVCAAGIHPARATLPILWAAVAVAVAAAAGGIRAAPGAERLGSPRAAAGPWRHVGDRIFALSRSDATGAYADGLSLFEVDARFRLRRSLHAAQVRVAGPDWELRGARLLAFDPGAPDAPPRAERAPAWLAAPGARLPSASPSARPAPQGVGGAPALAVLALLAVPLGLRVRPARGLAGPSLAALVCAASFRGAWQAAGFVAEQHPAAEPAAVGLVAASAAALGAALWWRAPR